MSIYMLLHVVVLAIFIWFLCGLILGKLWVAGLVGEISVEELFFVLQVISLSMCVGGVVN
jgi:hypothetical protein